MSDPADAPRAGAEDDARRRRSVVLVAEDDQEMRRLVAETLRGDGHDVVELRDGAALLVRVTRQYRRSAPDEPIDLIVSDLRMPVITGLAIVKGLREAHCNTPVILMTAFGDEDTRRAAEELGAVFLEKPFKMSALRSSVRAVLARAGGA